MLPHIWQKIISLYSWKWWFCIKYCHVQPVLVRATGINEILLLSTSHSHSTMMWFILLPWNVDLVLICTEFTSVFLSLLRSLWSNMFAALSAWCHLPDVITIHLISLSKLLKKIMNMLRHLQNNTANSCPAWQWTVNNYTQYLFHPGRVSLVCLSKCHVKTIRQLFEVKVDDNVTALPLFKKPIMLSWKKTHPIILT